jgi:hypothetical protein
MSQHWKEHIAEIHCYSFLSEENSIKLYTDLVHTHSALTFFLPGTQMWWLGGWQLYANRSIKVFIRDGGAERYIEAEFLMISWSL